MLLTWLFFTQCLFILTSKHVIELRGYKASLAQEVDVVVYSNRQTDNLGALTRRTNIWVKVAWVDSHPCKNNVQVGHLSGWHILRVTLCLEEAAAISRLYQTSSPHNQHLVRRTFPSKFTEGEHDHAYLMLGEGSLKKSKT